MKSLKYIKIWILFSNKFLFIEKELIKKNNKSITNFKFFWIIKFYFQVVN